MHFIYQINRLTTTKVDSIYMGKLAKQCTTYMTMNDNEITLFRHVFIIYKIYFTSAYVLITLVIKTYMCPGDLISAKLCRYHKATKIIIKYVLQ